MKKEYKTLIWSIVILSYLGLIISYMFLPDSIPIHWNKNWEVDRLVNKNFIFLIGGIPIVLLALLDFLPQIDPRKSNIQKNSKEYGIIKYALVLLLVAANWLSVLTALEISIDLQLIFPVLLGLTFMLLGNYMPKVKSNYFVGIKNPWALSNDTVWRKTHKMGGYLLFVVGILFIVMGIVKNTNYNIGVIVVLLLGVIAVNIYSYVLYKKLTV